MGHILKLRRRNNMSTVIKTIMNHEPAGYNPSTGIYASSVIFKGDWDAELENLDYHDVKTTYKEMEEVDNQKGQVNAYKNCAFRSLDGRTDSFDAHSDFWREENPADYKNTEAYENSPQLAAILDWFQVEKCRVRIFQQQPGHLMPLHTDFDNMRGNKYGETLRIFVQLSDQPGGAWYRFRTEDSEVNINLQKGQFLIFHPDHTGHQTQNLTEVPRNAFMLVVKRNEWLDSLVNHHETVTFVDTADLVSQKESATKELV